MVRMMSYGLSPGSTNFCAKISPAVKPVREVKHLVNKGCVSSSLLYRAQMDAIFANYLYLEYLEEKNEMTHLLLQNLKNTVKLRML
mmetsp:Transcript_23633/g.50265  ORF Transcript_23633/g.50265 Transcript_23633/m.50265 type:complete len:86 (+) Transcript_23633:718-975(+)